MKRLHNLKRVEVKEVKEVAKFYGVETLYKGENGFYKNLDNSTDEVYKLRATSEEEAVKEFLADVEAKTEEIAAVELLDYLDFDLSDVEAKIEEERSNGYLTTNTGRNGKRYIWYMDEANNAIIDIETGEIIEDVGFIESQLAD